jgi:hypothetical protein
LASHIDANPDRVRLEAAQLLRENLAPGLPDLTEAVEG